MTPSDRDVPMTARRMVIRTAELVATFAREARRAGADESLIRRASETFFDGPFDEPDLRGRVCITCARPLSARRLCVQCSTCFGGRIQELIP
jgi:hypothetical protein